MRYGDKTDGGANTRMSGRKVGGLGQPSSVKGSRQPLKGASPNTLESAGYDLRQPRGGGKGGRGRSGAQWMGRKSPHSVDEMD